MTLESAVVGGGVVSDKHLSGLQNCPETELVAVCDPDESRARTLAMEYDVDAYADVEALLAREELDWLHLCTPVESHLRIAEMALEDGITVQIEPPVTPSVGEAKSLERVARDSEGRLSIAHGHSFETVLREAVALLEDGRIGDLRSVDLCYASAGYPDDVRCGSGTTDRSGDEFETAVFNPIHALLGLGGHPSTADAIRAGTAAHRRHEEGFEYDGVQFSYTTADDVLCSATVVGSEVPHRTIQLHGDSGTIDIDLLDQSLTVGDGAQQPDTEDGTLDLLGQLSGRVRDAVGNAIPGTQRTDDDRTGQRERNPYDHQIERDARAIESGEPLSIPVVDGTWTLQIMDAIRTATDGPTDGDRIQLETDPT